MLNKYARFDPSFYELGMIVDASLVHYKVVGMELDCALFNMLHDKCLGKSHENVDYFSPFLDTLVKNHNDFVLINQIMSLLSKHIEFSSIYLSLQIFLILWTCCLTTAIVSNPITYISKILLSFKL